MSNPFYRVEVDTEGCAHCGHDTYYTVVWHDGKEDNQLPSSWADRELVEEICQFMNDAYEAGKETVL